MCIQCMCEKLYNVYVSVIVLVYACECVYAFVYRYTILINKSGSKESTIDY